MLEDLHFFNPRATLKENLILEFEKDPEKRQTQPTSFEQEEVAGWEEYNSGDGAEQAKKDKRSSKYLSKFMRSAQKFESVSARGGLTSLQFGTIIVLCGNTTLDLINYMDLYITYGTWIALFGYWLCTFILTTPLVFVFFFLGNYTRQMSFKFWCCVPVLKGLAVSLVFRDLVLMIFNMSYSTLSAYLFYSSLGNSSELTCGYTAVNKTCMTPGIATDLGQTCESEDTTLEFGVQSYLRYVADSSADIGVNWKWIAATIIAWIITCVTLQWSKSLIVWYCRAAICTIAFLLLFLISKGLFFGRMYRKASIHLSSDSVPISIYMIASVSIASLRSSLPGILVTYAAMSQPSIMPTFVALSTSTIHIIITFMFTNVYEMAVNSLINSYKITHASCIKTTGIEVIFAIIPEYLMNESWWPELQVPVFYFTMWLWGMLATFFIIHGIIEAIFDDCRQIVDHKKVITLMTVLFCFVACDLLANPSFVECTEKLKWITLAPLFMHVGVGIFVVFYTTMRIKNDYLFAFGTNLGWYWIGCLKIYVFYISVVAAGFTFFSVSLFYHNFQILHNFLITLVFIFPMICCAFVRTITYKNKKRKYLIKPDESWGHPTKATKDQRRRFNPKRECRYKSTMMCMHDCLQSSNALYDEVKFWKARENYFYVQYHVIKKSFRHVVVEPYQFKDK